MNFTDAKILKAKDGSYILRWGRDLSRNDSKHDSLGDAKETYYMTIAQDYMGSSIRDNSRDAVIQMGKDIETFGVDASGQIDFS